MGIRDSVANDDVLAFYRELPFNYRESAAAHAKQIKHNDALTNYPPLLELLKTEGARLLDVGCGAGWLSLSAAYHHGAVVTGIDFNSRVIERAQEVAGCLAIKATFECADLFVYDENRLTWLPQ